MRLAVLMTLLAVSLEAQEIYLDPVSFQVSTGERVMVLITGAAPARLRDASMYTSGGAYNMLNLRAFDGSNASAEVSVKGPGSPVLAIRTAPEVTPLDAAFKGLLVSSAPQTMGQPARQRAAGFAKAILLADGRPDDAWRRSANHTLEIIPEDNPYLQRAGGELALRVLRNGRAAANLPVTATAADGAAQRGRTDAAGRVVIRLSGAGKWRVHAVSIERCAEPAVAEWETFHATLAFETR